jgi:predicted esterase YcpF (UPF0227 family)
MKIVYFHGWNGIYDENRAKILGKFGDEVYYPNINYQHDKNLIHSYSGDLSKGDAPTLIVGSSLGGYLAFHVSNIIRCPSLIINPSFFLKNGSELRPNFSLMENYDKQIIISGKDEEIDVKRVLKFLKEVGYDSQINIYSELSHHVPLDIFENIFIEFREKYKNFVFEKPRDEKKSCCASFPSLRKRKKNIEPPHLDRQQEHRVYGIPANNDEWQNDIELTTSTRLSEAPVNNPPPVELPDWEGN